MNTNDIRTELEINGYVTERLSFNKRGFKMPDYNVTIEPCPCTQKYHTLTIGCVSFDFNSVKATDSSVEFLKDFRIVATLEG